MNQVLITGGSGFVGSHLIDALLRDESNEVHVFDMAPLDQALNLRDVKDHPRMIYTQGDIRNTEALRKWYRKDATALYHMAAVVGIKNYLADPLGLIDTIVGGTRVLLELARDAGTRFILASTSEIYGKNPAVPWDENGDRVLGPPSVDRWSYSSSKAVCEHMVHAIHRQTGLPFSIVRLFNVYGPRQNPIFVVSQSVYKALRGERPLLYDNGSQTRCFSFVHDIVQGILLAATKPEGNAQTFNLGNNTEVTIGQVMQWILDATGNTVQAEQFNTTEKFGSVYEDILRRVPAVEKAKKLLGWSATTSAEAGIRSTVQWARENPWWLADRKQ
ncbi:MAG: GDP-mannose 4,6-dehydratase [Leptospirales bacterium]|nr:GDP-mannose 4,6-dehydratase [Leptospirales bacterium]